MNNDQEWRSHLFEEIREIRKEVSEIKKEMMTLKLKVAGFSSLIGGLASYIWSKISWWHTRKLQDFQKVKKYHL